MLLTCWEKRCFRSTSTRFKLSSPSQWTIECSFFFLMVLLYRFGKSGKQTSPTFQLFPLCLFSPSGCGSFRFTCNHNSNNNNNNKKDLALSCLPLRGFFFVLKKEKEREKKKRQGSFILKCGRSHQWCSDCWSHTRSVDFFFFCVSFCDHMSYFEDSRAHRRASRVASAFTEYVRPEDANGPSSRQVDGDVWYATMFLYPNHWEAGRGGALPLPNSPYRQLPLWSMVCQAKDYLISLAFLIMLYVVVWSLFPTMQKSVGGTFWGEGAFRVTPAIYYF